MKLITAFDEKDLLPTLLIAMSLDFDEVIYVYRTSNKYNTYFERIKKIINKYKNTKVTFLRIDKKDTKLIELPLKYPDAKVDISGIKYLSLRLFDIFRTNNNELIYYDNQENVVKSYNTHKTLTRKIFNLKIEDILLLGGGVIKRHLHSSPNNDDEFTKQMILKIVDESKNDYVHFIAYIQRLNQILGLKENKLIYEVSKETINNIKSDNQYKHILSTELFKIEDNKVIFRNKACIKLMNVSGSILESYIYLTLKNSNLFDDVMMSAVIDFSSQKQNYPINCEIDALVMKDNHLLFMSLKSNKIDTSDLNEIKVHNTMFGNHLSKTGICTLEEVDEKSPSIYLKAKELDVAVVDRSDFNNNLAKRFLSILDGTYEYDEI